MTVSAIIALIVIGAMVCMLEWRTGMYLTILAGFLQDPMRKLYPGEPVAFTLLAAFFFGCCLVGAIARGEQLGFREVNRWNPILAVPAILFIAWVLFQTLRTAVGTHSVVLSGIGAIAYLAPLPALLLGGCYTARRGEMEKLLRFYIAIATIFSASLILELLGFHWKVLGSIGKGFIFFPEAGGQLVLRSGLFRSPEIAAWHAATAICLIVCLNVARKRGFATFGLGQAVMITLLFVAMILSGRRKFLVEIVMFLAIYGFILTYFTRGFHKLATFLVVCGTLSAAFYYYVSTQELAGLLDAYASRGKTVRAEAVDRFKQMTVDQFQSVVERNGILGLGAGTGSQGAQHFGGGVSMVGFSAEGGLSKVLAELGIPGLALLAVLGIAVMRYLWKACGVVRSDPEISGLSYGLTALLVANALVFTTAHQIFGDVFVLLLIGLMLSYLLNAPLLMHSWSGRTPLFPGRKPIPLRRSPAS